MRSDRLALFDPLPEILPLQHLLERDPTVEPDDVGERHFLEPIAIEDGAGSGRVEHFEGLGAIAFGVGEDLLVRELRSRNGTPARVADHGREIPDDEDCFVTEILKLSQLPQDHGVTEMQVGARWIDAKLDPERPA